jgi:cytidylate kinase
MKSIQIAIDGPASSGKSTVAKIIAKQLGYTYLDTGAMYRSATFLALKNGIEVSNQEKIVELLESNPIRFGRDENGVQLVFVGECDVTLPIRDNQVTNNVSAVAALPLVREKLVHLQREIAQAGGIVMDGRDIGTVVLPHAQVKVYLTASSMVRAKRRYDELTAKGESCDLEKIRQDIEDRDYRDMHRETSPLKQAEDAVLVDTSDMTIEQVIDRIVALIG